MKAIDQFQKILDDMNTTYFGLSEQNEVMLACLAARLPLYEEGPHGVAKTSRNQRLSKYFGEKAFYRQIRAQSTVYDVFYEYDLPALMKGERKIVPKALACKFVILDEFKKNPLFGSAIHDFIEDHVVDGIKAEWQYVAGLSNPQNEFYETNLALTDWATNDRWGCVNYINPPRTYDLFELGLRTERMFKPPDPDFKVPLDALEKAYEEVAAVEIPVEIHLRLQLLLSSLSECSYTPANSVDVKDVSKWMLLGSSIEGLCGACRHRLEICGVATCSPTRAQRAAIWLSKALAWVRGKDRVGQDEFEAALNHVLPHRIFYVPSFLRDHPTAQDAFKALYMKYQADMKHRTEQGAFQLLANIYGKIKKGAWDRDSYELIITKFADDLPLRKFTEGLKEKRYPRIRAALYEAAEKETDLTVLELMKQQLPSKGLDVIDEVELQKYIEEKVAGKTIRLQIGYSEDTRNKVVGKLTLALAPHVQDVKALNVALRNREAFVSRDFPGMIIQHDLQSGTEGTFTITVVEQDTAAVIRKKLGLPEGN
jgi:MoxR-like ATPase